MRTPSLRATSWMGWLFAVGSACFAVGVPMSLATSLEPTVAAATYFVGSIFFTTAATIQMTLAWRAGPNGERLTTRQALLSRHPAWTSAWIQWIGTLAFNATTFWGLVEAVGTHSVPDQVIWRPDAVGSVLFLVSSAIALMPDVRRHRHGHARDRSWAISAVNMLGSIFFGFSAVGAWVVPSSDQLLNSQWSNGGTLLGAVCFLVGALLVIPRRATAPVNA
ncbi:MAG TPA: hypothetical protein VFX15_09630 [Actinomycetes bacterium]|nr:hypothetical protein [Actinomycetes bacterium]